MSAKPGYIHTSYAQDMAFYRTRLQRIVVGVGTLIVLLAPLRMDSRQLDLATTIVLAIPAAMALNLLTGLAGQVSLGTAAFLAVGGFTAAGLGSVLGWPVPLVLAAATCVAALLGAVVGLPALRLRGLYLIVATMAFHFLALFAARRYQEPRVGPAGFRMSRWEPFGVRFEQTHWYLLLAALAVLSTIGYVNLRRSRFGRAWMMIRERDIAAEILGVNVTRYKLMAFTLSSAVIGLSGALLGYNLRTVEVETFPLDLSIDFVAIIIIGGLGSVHGAIFGALLVFGVPFLVTELTRTLPRDSWLAELVGSEIYNINRILYGLAIIAFLLFEPRGLAHIWERTRAWFQLWPFSKERL